MSLTFVTQLLRRLNFKQKWARLSRTLANIRRTQTTLAKLYSCQNGSLFRQTRNRSVQNNLRQQNNIQIGIKIIRFFTRSPNKNVNEPSTKNLCQRTQGYTPIKATIQREICMLHPKYSRCDSKLRSSKKVSQLNNNVYHSDSR